MPNRFASIMAFVADVSGSVFLIRSIRYKQKQVYDNLTRIGKVELPEFMPILGSEKTMFYRNKLEFTFSNKRWLTEEEVKQDVKYDQDECCRIPYSGSFR